MSENEMQLRKLGIIEFPVQPQSSPERFFPDHGGCGIPF
jgi:hypothetical protein